MCNFVVIYSLKQWSVLFHFVQGVCPINFIVSMRCMGHCLQKLILIIYSSQSNFLPAKKSICPDSSGHSYIVFIHCHAVHSKLIFIYTETQREILLSHIIGTHSDCRFGNVIMIILAEYYLCVCICLVFLL